MGNENSNVLGIDINKKLEIKINNQKPVGLADLTLSLLAFNQQFQKFVEIEASTKDLQVATDLFIKEVRSGSIIVELVAQAIPVLPLFWEGGSLNEWVNQAKAILEWLLNKSDSPPREFSKQDLKQWHSIIEPIAKDSASQMNFSVSDNGQVINQFFFNSQEANAAQNSIKRHLEHIDQPNDHIYRKKVMYWYQTKFDAESHTGDKAIIEAITKKPLKVMFENSSAKEAMLSGDPRFEKPWHTLAYIVDVSVQTICDAPKVYTILNYYPEDTFDPAD